ncbi:unnamed protein product [Moneuplotes crassus]|uniref:Uncharacterized protein n=1 Tax=Euplotes crassus TaxID=5936 RepID=A0AAD1U1P5_EUPCR|nr:unnamed protein product [Moneuplotes crassus]
MDNPSNEESSIPSQNSHSNVESGIQPDGTIEQHHDYYNDNCEAKGPNTFNPLFHTDMNQRSQIFSNELRVNHLNTKMIRRNSRLIKKHSSTIGSILDPAKSGITIRQVIRVLKKEKKENSDAEILYHYFKGKSSLEDHDADS